MTIVTTTARAAITTPSLLQASTPLSSSVPRSTRASSRPRSYSGLARIRSRCWPTPRLGRCEGRADCLICVSRCAFHSEQGLQRNETRLALDPMRDRRFIESRRPDAAFERLPHRRISQRIRIFRPTSDHASVEADVSLLAQEFGVWEGKHIASICGRFDHDNEISPRRSLRISWELARQMGCRPAACLDGSISGRIDIVRSRL